MYSKTSKSKKLTPEYLKTVSRKFDLGIIFILNLPNKNISDISCISQCHMLYTVDLSNNIIRDISCFKSTPKLNFIDLSYNMISNIEPLASCLQLTSIRLIENQIKDINQLKHLSHLPELKSVSLMTLKKDYNNDICAMKGYRLQAINILGNIQRLDSVPVEIEEFSIFQKSGGDSLQVDEKALNGGGPWYGNLGALERQYDRLKKREGKMEVYDKRVKDSKKKCKERKRKLADMAAKINSYF